MDRESNILLSVLDALHKSFVTVNPFLAAIVSTFCWLVAPEESLLLLSLSLLTIVVADFGTKIWALANTNGGLRSAVQQNVITSIGMRKGVNKLIAYLLVLVLSSLFVRANYQVGIEWIKSSVQLSFIVAVVFLWLIEIKSVVENLIDGGVTSMTPLLHLIQRKKAEIGEKILGSKETGEKKDA
ncbi:hypothetical protein GJ688_02105 [Heliobacillus mobilis]|uniref:Holin n=1 Tax=Heliobacterium mobile TaxID=28064 RepID=A0A6I3SFN6_HELMO|nr:hypothetical protein [Heliobacterium mobile]MTV47776.1 hypothetical protein [Heliobacterium mobile]